MHCPFCNALETKVIDSRLANDGLQVRRRRECGDCKERFTTYEAAELSLPRVIKRDGTRHPFDENKLRTGIMKALERRPVDSGRIEEAITKVKHQLMSRGEREIDSRTIGEWMMDMLRTLDHVAYVRFASVYRSFEDMNAFREVIDNLENDNLEKEQND